MSDRIDRVPLGQDAVYYYSKKAIEYWQKAKDTKDKMLRPALEAAAREFERRAYEARQAISENKAIQR